MNPLYMVGMLADLQKKRKDDKSKRFILLNRLNGPNETSKLSAFIDLEIRKFLGQNIDDYRIKTRKSEHLTKRDCLVYFFYALFKENTIKCTFSQFAEIFNLGDHSTTVTIIQRTPDRIKNPQYPEYQKFWDKINTGSH